MEVVGEGLVAVVQEADAEPRVDPDADVGGREGQQRAPGSEPVGQGTAEEVARTEAGEEGGDDRGERHQVHAGVEGDHPLPHHLQAQRCETGGTEHRPEHESVVSGHGARWWHGRPDAPVHQPADSRRAQERRGATQRVVDAVEVVVEAAEQADARIVGVTGGVAAGKSTLAVAVADRLGAAVVASDGFLFDNATLAERGLTHRKGFPESFDGSALVAFLDGWLATGRAVAPVYSHLAYDIVGTVEVAGDRLVVEGLHLGHPALGGRDRIDLLVHLDGADDDLARWFLQRFQGLRAAAADDPEAFLHQFRDLPGEVLDQMAMEVWAGVNLVVLEEAVRPWAAAADFVIHLGPSHEVVLVERHP